MGRIVGVGKGVTEVEFGDLLEMTRYGGDWVHHSLNTREGVFGGKHYDQYVSEDGEWCCLVPDSAPDMQKLWHGYLHQVPGLITRARWERAGIIPARILYPLSDRVLMRLTERPQEINGVVDPHFRRDEISTYGLVEEVGQEVVDLKPGDWAIVPPRAGTWYEMEDGERWLTIEEPEVLGRYPEGDDHPAYVAVVKDAPPERFTI